MTSTSMKSHSKTPWRETEIEYIRKFWGRVTAREMARILGRSYSSVRNKGFELGLSKKKRESKSKERESREIPPHLIEPFRHFVCEVIEGSPKLQRLMREKLTTKWGMGL